MRAHQIADMDIIANARAVRCRVIGAINRKSWALAERGFASDLDEMGSTWARLTGAATWVGASSAFPKTAAVDEKITCRTPASIAASMSAQVFIVLLR
jgi:hypothetical protein